MDTDPGTFYLPSGTVLWGNQILGARAGQLAWLWSRRREILAKLSSVCVGDWKVGR